MSDSKRVSFVSETLVFSADIKTYTDYYAFGMEMVGRNWSEGDAYRQGFNGKENDKDFGEGVQDYGMRVSDTQTCRFFSVDPITAQYPELTPYQFASNTPILCIDLDGLEGVIYNGKEIARGPVREECYQSVITSYKREQGGIPVLPKLDHTQTQNKQSTIYVDSPNLNKVARDAEAKKTIYEKGEKGIESDLTLFTLFTPAIKIGQNIPRLVQFGINLFSPVGVSKSKVFSNQGGEFLDDALNTAKYQANYWYTKADNNFVGSLASRLGKSVEDIEVKYSFAGGKGDVDIVTKFFNVEVKSGHKMKLEQSQKNSDYAKTQGKGYLLYMPNATNIQIYDANKKGITVIKDEIELKKIIER